MNETADNVQEATEWLDTAMAEYSDGGYLEASHIKAQYAVAHALIAIAKSLQEIANRQKEFAR